MSKKMLSQEDVSQVRKIVREEIKGINGKVDGLETSVKKLGVAVADLQVDHKEMKETLNEVSASNKKILSSIDAFVKNNEDLKTEQKIHGALLSKHVNIIEKVKQVLK